MLTRIQGWTDFYHTQLNKGIEYRKQHQYELAIKVFLLGIRESTSVLNLLLKKNLLKDNIRAPLCTGIAHFNTLIGHCFLDQHNHEKACTYYLAALKADPSYIDASVNLISIYSADKNFALAEQHAKLALQHKQENTNPMWISFCYSALIHIFYQKNNYKKVVSFAKEALPYFPENSLERGEVCYRYAASLVELNLDLQKAIQLFELAYACNYELPYTAYNLGILYDKENENFYDSKKAIEFLSIAAEFGMPQALYKMSDKLEHGKGCEINDAKAFQFLETAAKQNYAAAQTELARYYTQGIGCEINYDTAMHYAEQAMHTVPLAKYIFSGLLISDAIISNNFSNGRRAIKLLAEVSREGIDEANFLLAKVYRYGQFTPSNFALAELYYRRALNEDCPEYYQELLEFYLERLNSGYLSDAHYRTTQVAIAELQCYSRLSAEEFNNLLSKIEARLKDKSLLCKKVNFDISQINAKGNLAPADKIQAIIKKLSADTIDTINLSIGILKISELFDQCTNGEEIWKKYTPDLILIYKMCWGKIREKVFSTRGLCNLITGTAKLFRYGYDPIIAKYYRNIYSHLFEQHGKNLNYLDMNSLLDSITRTPFSWQYFAPNFLELINQILEAPEKYLAEEQGCASLLYHLAMLDNYKRCTKRFPFKLNNSLLTPFLCHAFNALEKNMLTREDAHQYFLALLYFNHFFSHLFKGLSVKKLADYAAQFSEIEPNVHISQLQKKISHYLSSLPSLKAEQVINTFPVDLLYNDELIIQVEGPHHFYYKDKTGQHHLTLKDLFHDTLLNLRIPGIKCQHKFYKILHLDYKEYEKRNKAYLREALEQEGINLPNRWEQPGILLFRPPMAVPATNAPVKKEEREKLAL